LSHATFDPVFSPATVFLKSNGGQNDDRWTSSREGICSDVMEELLVACSDWGKQVGYQATGHCPRYEPTLSEYKLNLGLRNKTLGNRIHVQHRNTRTPPVEGSAHDNGRTMVCVEYGNTEGSSNPKSAVTATITAPQRAPKWTNFKPTETTRNKAILKELANRSAYQIQYVTN
jgi:hypothetical protein